MLESWRRGLLACTAAMAVVGMAILAAMMLTIGYDVVARYVFRAPTDWAYPSNALGVLASTVLAMPHIYATKRHIALDLLYRQLPRRGRFVSDICRGVVTAAFGAALTVGAGRSLVVTYTAGLTGSGTFSIPLWIADAILTLSGFALLLVAVSFPQGDDPAKVPPPTAEPAPAHVARDR